ncbi:MAG: hypothetical protein HGA22_05695 [Clostridiales bacterium]|nr:hypothetical protein [Clostridiales bacterium]
MSVTTGKILRVNLSTQNITEESPEMYEKRFIGGRGVGAWILFNEMRPDTKPLDPESIMVFSTGPLTGTDFPGSGRLSIESKNCNTTGINWANVGGHFSAELKQAGWSYLVVEGTSETPVYLLIHNEQVELRSAAHLWGRAVRSRRGAV